MKKLLLLLPIFIGSCAVINQNKMQDSQKAYIDCLRLNQNDKAECEVEKVQYESDKSTFEHTGSGLLGIEGHPSVSVIQSVTNNSR